MNLKWNPNFRRFEVEFHDFQAEQPLVKSLGFKTDGPPAWVWYSLKAAPLTKLRENRPATLNIDANARAEYEAMKVMEDRNAAAKAEAAKQAKALKKKLQIDKQDKLKPDEYFDEQFGFTCIRVENKDFTPTHKYIPPPPPETTCFICGVPVYSYEYREGNHPACMWCTKIVLDNADVL